ncbi:MULTISPECIES: excisionase [Faecalibacterium]|uniref:excisionase n=1 Tax=Faecalibacterium TaxID=216851 RepID=UPI000E4C0797|nr:MULTISPECIES: excisionase [Faecalibacterium]RHQ27527.1 transposase [Faecalibacterium sp. AF28-13AC]
MKEVPIWEKAALTIEEAAAYSNIGQCKLRELIAMQNCPFVMFVGKKQLVKRKAFEKYIDQTYSI